MQSASHTLRQFGLRQTALSGRGVKRGSSGDELSPLRDVVEEGKHALHEQLRGTFVVVGQAVVGE